MKHTYLFEEGTWETNGSYFDETGNTVPVYGRTVITHADSRWFSRGFTRLLLDPPREYQNNYELDPIEPGEEFTAWKSQSPGSGTLRGTFMIVEDSILSAFTSDDGEYKGHEYLLQIDENTYQNRGFSFRGAEKLSSWAVVLTRIQS